MQIGLHGKAVSPPLRTPLRGPAVCDFPPSEKTVKRFTDSLSSKLIDGGRGTESFIEGTLAGAGSFRCEECGFGVALHEMDEVPACPHCGGASFKRGSIFGDRAAAEPIGMPTGATPDWVAEARDALVEPGHYVAYDDGERVRVVALQDGWTRLGRSLSAHVRFDDPTVSRRHALIHCDERNVRVLDDRSLNGVFLNGERVDWHELADGDQIRIGAFDLYYICLTGPTATGRSTAAAAGVG